MPPPEMVANLRACNLDGYLAPDPFNQRAVFEDVGFIHLLSKERPNTFRALLSAIVDATQYARDRGHRNELPPPSRPRTS